LLIVRTGDKFQHEVDFIIEDQIAIEVKATKDVSLHDLKNLKILQEEKILSYFTTYDRKKARRNLLQPL
jgi:hypothetical protein